MQRETADYETPIRDAPTTTGRARVVAAIAAAAVLVPLASCSTGESSEHAKPIRASGKPDQLTVVDPKNVPDLGEQKESSTKGLSTDVSFPKVPNAGPLTERLGDLIDQRIGDFENAANDPEKVKVTGDISAAGDGVLGVRLAQDETDAAGTQTGYATFWYNTATGHTAYSTELLAGNKELDTLDGMVKKSLKDENGDDVDGSMVQPTLALYDSMGFNPHGDLVVEFDEGQVAPAKVGRVRAVVKKDDASPLLSKFGTRARKAATIVTPKFSIDKPARSPKDGTSAERASIPGLRPSGGTGRKVDCADAKSKCIALTFDDGPGPRTPDLLDTLDEKDAKATFFLTGEPVREFPESVRREYAEGHELGNHTVHHPDLASMGEGEIRDELDPVNAQVRRETGYKMRLARPPYGSTDSTVSKVAKDEGLAEVMWSVDTNDWRDRDSTVVRKQVMKSAKPGSIVLMHDIHGTTVDAVPDIVDELKEEGFTMVTVSQLLGDTKPGTSYRDGHPEKDSTKDDKKDKDGKKDKDKSDKDDKDGDSG